MPWLDLLTENNVNLTRILLAEQWEYRSVNGVEHLGAEWADIIEVEFESMYRSLNRGSSKPRARELGCKSHV